MRRRLRRPALAGLGAFVAVLGIGAAVVAGNADTSAEAPADADTLAHIARKNDDAAILAAARMKARAGRTDAAAQALAQARPPVS